MPRAPADDRAAAAQRVEEARTAHADGQPAARRRRPGVARLRRQALLPRVSELPGNPRIQLRERVRHQRGAPRRRDGVWCSSFGDDGVWLEGFEGFQGFQGFQEEDVSSLVQLETILRERLAGTLPGLEAQLRFMPTPPPPGWKPGESPSDARIAAGLLLVYPGERGASIPLTVRASHLKRHAGQISLPGGATDEGETLVQAALREAHEEIGVDPARVRILGQLTPVH